MSPAARLALVDPADPALSIAAQCRLLKVARSTLYYRPVPVSADDLTLMRQMDELHLAYPFYGSRRLAAALQRDDWSVNRKRIKRLRQVMGLEAIYQKPNTSQAHPYHKVYPYLLRGLVIDRPNQVWCADITYIPMAKGFVYLVAGTGDRRSSTPIRGAVHRRGFWPVRLSGTENRHKAVQKSHAEVGFLSGLRPPFITVSGSEKSYRPRKLRWRQISGERWAMLSLLTSMPSDLTWRMASCM
jgi:hypothetical protein